MSQTYGIDIIKRFLDPERARIEILENNARDYPNDIDPDIQGLISRDKDVMDRLELKEVGGSTAANLEYFMKYLPEYLDGDIKRSILHMMYTVPQKDVVPYDERTPPPRVPEALLHIKRFFESIIDEFKT